MTRGLLLVVGALVASGAIGFVLAKLETWEPPEREKRKRREKALEDLHLESRAPVWPAKNEFGEDWP